MSSARLFDLCRAALAQVPDVPGALDRVREQVRPADVEAATAVIDAARALSQPADARAHLAPALTYWRTLRLLTPAAVASDHRLAVDDAAEPALAGPAPATESAVATPAPDTAHLRSAPVLSLGILDATDTPGPSEGVLSDASSALSTVLRELANYERDPAEPFAAMAVRALAGGSRPMVVAEAEHVVAVGEDGVTRLMLAVMDGGPPGLHPDPERMALSRPTEEFASAAQAAWTACALAEQGRSVLWAAENVDGTPLDAVGGDLGRAFAAALADADARVRRADTASWWSATVQPWLRRRVPLSRPLVTGLLAAVTATALVLLALDLTGWHKGEDRSAVADRLAARALGVAAEDPQLAAQLALAAHDVDPTDQTAGLLRQLGEDERYVARRFNTGTGALDAVAQDDGRQMAFTAGPNGGVRAWSSWDGASLGRVSGSSDIVALACDPASPLLAGADSDGDVLLWRTADLSRTSTPVRLPTQYPGGETPTIGLGFNHDGSQVYRVADNGELQVWDTRTHKALTRTGNSLKAPGHQVVIPVAVSDPYTTGTTDTSESILIATDDNGIVSYDFKTHRTTDVLSAGQARGPISSLAADDSTGTLTAAVGSPSGLSLWTLGASHHETFPYAGITTAVDALTHRSDDMLAVGTGRGVDLVTADGGIATSRPQGGYAGQFATSTSPDGRYLVVGGAGDTVTVLNVDGAGLTPTMGEASTVLAYDPRGNLLLNTLDGGSWATGLYTVRPDPAAPDRRESTTRTRRAFLPGADWWRKGSPFYANAGALTASFAAVAGQDPDYRATVLVWDARTGKALRHLVFPGDASTTVTDSDTPPNIAVSVLFDDRLHLMVARDSYGQIAAWSTRNWRLALRVSTGVVGGGGLALSPDGTSALLTVGSAGTRDVAVRNRLVRVDLRTHHVDSVALDRWAYVVAYAPDGSRVAVLTTDDTVRFVNSSGRRLPDTPVIRLPGPATSLAYSPNGRYLAVGDGIGKVLVYRTSDGQLAYPAFELPSGQSVVDVAWDPSGTLLTATGGMLGEHPHAENTYFWSITPGRWVTRACALAGGELTPTAWAEYVGSSTPHHTLCDRDG